MNPREKARRNANVRSFLQKIAAALRQAAPPSRTARPDALRILEHSVAGPAPGAAEAGAVNAEPCSAFRMRCIRLLQEEEALTLKQAADLMELPLEAVRRQFNELRQLRLIEPCGVRSTPEGIRPVFCLNPTHPGLEFVLGPEPGAACISQTDPEESLLEITLDSA